MAGETLQDFATLLSEFPDNTANLIVPVAERNTIWAMPLDFGEVEDDSDFVAPMTDGVWVDIPTLLPAAVLDVGRAWEMDGNNKLIPTWTNFITVNDPTTRGVSYTVNVVIEKVGSVSTLTANYDNVNGDGAPALGDINWHSNLTSARISYTDDDGGDQTVTLQSTEVGDVLNAQGIWRQVLTVAANAGDLEVTFDPTPRPAPTGGGDPAPTMQMLRTGSSPYELRATENGIQVGEIRDFELAERATFAALNEFASYNAALQLPWSFEIRSVGHSTDINVKFARHRTFGVLI